MIPTEAVGIALDDTRLLADVLGGNVYYLRAIERLHGVRVSACDNQPPARSIIEAYESKL